MENHDRRKHFLGLERSNTGEEIFALIRELYPICRSITGSGVRQTLSLLQQSIPLEIREVPSGTRVFDWVVPKEWNIRDAYVKDPGGRRIIDFKKSNLHVVGYSVPVEKRRMGLESLSKHLISLKEHPDWIPFVTSYYEESWGFCLPHRQLTGLENTEYEVCIDSTLEDGHLTYGELLIPGREASEVLISSHICHPSLCNDNLSAVSVAAFLARHLLELPTRLSYRFLFAPGTIGAITWLAQNQENTHTIKHGLVLACLGDSGDLRYKGSRRGNHEIDQAAAVALRDSGEPHKVVDFSPWGSDERQFCSPGFDLPVGSLTRTPFAEYPENHTSADNLDFIRTSSLADSMRRVLEIFWILEENQSCLNLNPMCEPQLGKRDLYRSRGGRYSGLDQLALLWVLNQSDGRHTLLEIAERSGLHFEKIHEAALALIEHGLLKRLAQ